MVEHVSCPARSRPCPKTPRRPRCDVRASKGYALFVLSRPLPRLGRVSDVRGRRPAWRSAVWLCIAVVAVWSAMASLRPATSSAAPSPPFGECPAIGDDASCGVLIVVNPDGTTTSYVDSSQGPVDGSDDVLVGILNTSASTVTTVPLTGNGIFALDGDGLCTLPNAPSGCPFGPTSYEGPNTSFSITDENTGAVMFANGLAPGASAYFSLEGAASSVSPPPPGAVLGSLDLNGYCRSLGYSNAALSNPQNGPQAAYNNWTCVAANGSTAPIDMQMACEATYPERPILAQPTDPDDAYTWRCYQLSQPAVISQPTVKIAQVVPGNGTVTVSWVGTASTAVTSYMLTASPDGNDRLPAPPLSYGPPAPVSVPASASSATLTGLVEDCHQLYTVSVTPEGATGPVGPTVTSSAFRPSGIVSAFGPSYDVPSGVAPPYVVILLDGIGEFKPGFQMNPYDPTNPNDVASYCPENVNAAGQPVANDFPHEPAGPWEFFRKWNYYDPSDTAGGNDPITSSNSTPRYIGRTVMLAGGKYLSSGDPTHSFMLDAIAARGAVILPYSYVGARLTVVRGKPPQFTFNAYTACNSSPGGIGGFGCDRDPGGSPDPRQHKSDSFSIDQDEQRLAKEVDSVTAVWPHVPIVIVGHSQGGLIAFEAWRHGLLHGVAHLFSLDSPINGVCPLRVALGPGPSRGSCVGPAGYPSYDDRVSTDRTIFGQDLNQGNPFRFIGTNGDEVHIVFKLPVINTTVVDQPAYGTGNKTLQHQLLVRKGRCVSKGNDSGCPEAPRGPNHISNCPIPDSGWIHRDQHFIVKFCPGNVSFFNQTLGLTY